MSNTKVSRFLRSNRSVPLILLLATLVSFGLLIPWLGFYWDDWPIIYMKQTQGIHGFWDFYQYDRPLSAWTYIVFTPLLGTHPLVWQIFTLLLRWGAAVFLWASLKVLWPKKGLQALWVALLFAVFPIFTQQPVAVAYSQHWLVYLFYFASVYCMLMAQEKRQHFYVFTALSVVLSAIEMLTMEYFLGLELLRPVFLWIYFYGREPGLPARPMLKRVFAAAWIYLVLFVGCVIWRLFFLHLAGNDPNQPVFFDFLKKAPLQAMIDLCQKVLQDLVYLLIAWVASLKPANIDLHRPFFLFSLVVAITIPVLLGFIISRYLPSRVDDEQDAWHVQAMLFGVLAVLLGTLPVWLIERQISVGPLGNRFSLAAMFGVSLLIVGFLEWLSPRKTAKLIVICVLIGLALHINLYTAKSYQQSWEKQRAFYWQLFWRAPYILPGTAFISDGEIFPYVGLYSTSMGISLLYPPVNIPQKMPYWFFSYWEHLYKFPSRLVQGATLEGGIRNYTFSGSSKDALVLNFMPEEKRCLYILSTRDSDDKRLPGSISGLLSISNLERIQQVAPGDWTPPESIFGQEPEHDWCYYFEKAELAYQDQDWPKVIRLMDEAKGKGLSPSDMQEYLPLLHAYLKTGSIQPALKLSIQIKNLSDKMDDRVCNAWFDASKENSSSEFSGSLDTVRNKFSCFD